MEKEQIDIWDYINEFVEKSEAGTQFTVIGECNICHRKLLDTTRKEKHTFLGYEVTICYKCINNILKMCGINE